MGEGGGGARWQRLVQGRGFWCGMMMVVRGGFCF